MLPGWLGLLKNFFFINLVGNFLIDLKDILFTTLRYQQNWNGMKPSLPLPCPGPAPAPGLDSEQMNLNMI